MSYTLTENELKVAKCGKLDYTKFKDSSKGYLNTENNSAEYLGFIAQDVLDAGFTEEEGKTILESLISKGVLIDLVISVDDITKLNEGDYGSWVKDCISKKTGINNKWMFFLSQEYINYIASQN